MLYFQYVSCITLCSLHAFSHQTSQEPCEAGSGIITPCVDKETKASVMFPRP